MGYLMLIFDTIYLYAIIYCFKLHFAWTWDNNHLQRAFATIGFVWFIYLTAYQFLMGYFMVKFDTNNWYYA